MSRFHPDDTIVAIATPAGRGGLGVVRLSGPDANVIARHLIGREDALEPRRATFCRIADPDRPARTLDQVVATWFVAPRSFTGEDVVELSAHGSPPVLQLIVELAMRAGARLAEPGEFSLRAYLNGRMDLIQAEAIADVVDAVTPLQARAAMDQLEGTLTSRIAAIDAALFDLAAKLEASLDFPEEGFHFITRESASRDLAGVSSELGRLIGDGRTGRVVREGRLVVIVGEPNAGKSTLFNALVGVSRAIVTEVPGTTRDLLTERVDVEGLLITLVDTAGLREAQDPIEREGVGRAQDAARVAALTLAVLDGSRPLAAAGMARRSADDPSALVVVTKRDLSPAWPIAALGLDPNRVVEVSATMGEGLGELRRRIVWMLTSRDDLRDPPAVSNIRHLDLLNTAAAAVERAERSLAAGATEELVLADLAFAREALEAMTGARTPDDLLHYIFARFCVGK